MLTRDQRDELLGRIKAFYLAPFRVLAAMFRTFGRNRSRLRDFTRQPRVATVLRYGMLFTLLAWLLIAALNREQQDDRLPDALRGLWPGETPGTSAE
jgi:Flp pilus assembly pilin Flp